MFKNERSFLKRSSTASHVVILYCNKMRLLSMKKNLKDPMNEKEDAFQKFEWKYLLQNKIIK